MYEVFPGKLQIAFPIDLAALPHFQCTFLVEVDPVITGVVIHTKRQDEAVLFRILSPPRPAAEDVVDLRIWPATEVTMLQIIR